MTDPKEIAEGLSEADRAAIIDMRWADVPWPLSEDGWPCCEYHATLLGLEVRNHLLNKEEAPTRVQEKEQ